MVPGDGITGASKRPQHSSSSQAGVSRLVLESGLRHEELRELGLASGMEPTGASVSVLLVLQAPLLHFVAGSSEVGSMKVV